MAESESFLELDEVTDSDLSAVIKFQGIVRGFLVRRLLWEIRQDYEEIVKDIDSKDIEIHWPDTLGTPTFKKSKCSRKREEESGEKRLIKRVNHEKQTIHKNEKTSSVISSLQQDHGGSLDRNLDFNGESNPVACCQYDGSVRQEVNSNRTDCEHCNSNSDVGLGSCYSYKSNVSPVVLDQGVQIDLDTDTMVDVSVGGGSSCKHIQTDDFATNIEYDKKHKNVCYEDVSSDERNSNTESKTEKDSEKPKIHSENIISCKKTDLPHFLSNCENQNTARVEYLNSAGEMIKDENRRDFKMNLTNQVSNRSSLTAATNKPLGAAGIFHSHVDAVVSPIKFSDSPVPHQLDQSLTNLYAISENGSEGDEIQLKDVETEDARQSLSSSPVECNIVDREHGSNDKEIISSSLDTMKEEPDLPDDKEGLLELKKTLAMELLWIQQAINSRKHYLQLKQQIV